MPQPADRGTRLAFLGTGARAERRNAVAGRLQLIAQRWPSKSVRSGRSRNCCHCSFTALQDKPLVDTALQMARAAGIAPGG